ncbi:MAG: inverse autotransporter beta domain-containing protein [Alphaproteobacteria bacterium]|nr:inverse autotransporter beta domain-containing protein [Alphaproteobacteria bacterium]
MNYRFNTALLLALLYSTSALAQEASEHLKPRIEGNARVGNERSIGMTEAWIPLMQNDVEASVLYGDLRLMDDNQDNNEGNIGVGYRKMVTGTPMGDGIAGANIWYDRRHTDLGTNFNQVTVGAEWLGDEWDARANVYIPLNKKKDYIGAVAGGGGFTGTQIVAFSNQNLTEEALTGVDLEFGWRLPLMDAYTDSTRVYGGGYHFTGDDADDVTGYRVRITSDITEDFQVGTRFQRDDERGSQGFMEATIRFPFGNKQSYKTKGLKARLDESPERDIDIVSGQAVTGTRTSTVLNNATTAAAQEVWHVDNTAAGGGDGSYENPFNTLAAAEAAAGAHDVIYVHHGDGTTTGMDAGITIDDVGQKLIGSGVAITPSLINVDVSGLTDFTSNSTLIAASTAPSLTNSAGDIVLVTADKAVVSGISASNASGIGNRGISVDNSSGAAWDSVKITHVTANNNTSYGVVVAANNAGSSIANITLDNIVANDSVNAAGVLVFALDATINTLTATNLTTNNNLQRGVYVRTEGNGSLTGSLSDVTATSNSEGLLVWALNGSSISLEVENMTSTGNAANGVYIFDDSTGSITADLGGGGLGSAGNNAIHSNTGTDLRVDIDGATLKAENNWWGVNTGLDGGETTLEAASTVDASPFLTSAP